MGKSIEAAKALLEEMASNNYHWASKSVTPKSGGGKHAVDTVTLLASRVDTLAQRLEKVATSSATSAGPSMGIYAICEACGVQVHTSVECYNAPSNIEHVNAYHTYTSPPQNNPHPTSYSQGWKSHLNPLYKNPNPHPQNSMQPPGFHNRAPYTPPPPPPEPTSHLESFIERFIATQTTTNETLKESIHLLTSGSMPCPSIRKRWTHRLLRLPNR